MDVNRYIVIAVNNNNSVNSSDFHDTDVKSVYSAPPRVNPGNDRTLPSMESHYGEQETHSKVSMTSDATSSLTPYFHAQPSSTVFNPTGSSLMYIYIYKTARTVL